MKSDAQDPADDKSGKTKRDTETSRTPAAPVLAAAETAESAAPRGSDAKVVGDGDFRPADELDAEPAVADLPVPSRNKGSAAADQATTPRKRWGMAPVRWGGTLSAGLRRSTSENSTSTTSEIYEARLRANSYIWKPYIALVSGDFALTAIRSQDSGDAASSNLAGTSVTGSGTLNLFPQSRFPFTASLALSDSRSNGSFSTSNIEQRRLSLRQDYRPQIGQWTAAAGYDRSELTGTFGSDTVDRVFGNYSNVLGKHSVNLSGDFTRSRADGQSSRSYYLGGGHGFSFSDELSLNTNASITGQQFGIGSEDSTTAKTQSTQVFSYANWTPMDSKWRGSANLRYFETNNTIAGTTFESRTLGGAANLTYQASRNLSFFGTAGINVDSDRRVNSNQALGVSYSGDPRHLGGYDYTWFTSASATNSTAAKGITSRSINGSLGHSLVRSWQISDQSLLSGSVTQSVTNSRTTGLGSASTTTLNHGASLSMQANAGDRLTGYLSTSFSDSRTRGDATSSFQLFNVQLTGNWRVDANSELDSNLTWQWSRQQSDRINQPVVLIDQFGRPVFRDDTSRTGNTSLSGGVGYSHRRFAGIRGLRYRLDFRANTNRDDSRRFGNPDALREQDRATLDLDQRLLYRIGRLDTELQYRIAEIRGERNQLLFFRVIREFGSF
ncbi:hypothetical protein [Azoarcus sp. DN11]|uniref:hypothetical protein n=1 Tax=Azoarcus sp. DN11 TaxID=356837 RepID=UPI00256FC210|nr:hypothetical protein [Azoarcus sp. DN11]